MEELGDTLTNHFGPSLKGWRVDISQENSPLYSVGYGGPIAMSQGPTVYKLQFQLELSPRDDQLDMEELTFGHHRPQNLTSMSNFAGGWDIIAVYMLSDHSMYSMDSFVKELKDASWRRFNRVISKQIDEVINND